MDSPLMPTLHRQADMDTTSLLADMSLASPPDSPLSRPLARLPDPIPASDHNSTTAGETSQHSPSPNKVVQEKPKTKPRFSLFAQPTSSSTSSNNINNKSSLLNQSNSSHQGRAEDVRTGEEDGGEDETVHQNKGIPRISNAERDEKLRESLYELREMNNIFEGFLGALEDARGHNQRLAARVSQTSALLDQYTLLLGQTEHTQQLLLNPNWTGAEDDALLIQRREEEEAAAAAATLEAERRETDRKERLKAAKEVASPAVNTPGATGARGRGRGRGVPGAGTRVVSGTGRGRGTGIATGIPRPSTVGGRNGGVRPTSAGGKYADVKSSGYGPKRAS